MHSAITSKLSLYDIISMVVPGGIILGVLLLCIPEDYFVATLKPIPEWAKISLFAIGSYIVGLINHLITELVWRRFRNNYSEIQSVYDAVDDKLGSPDRSYYVIVFIVYLLVYLLLCGGVYLYGECDYGYIFLLTFSVGAYFFYTDYYSHSWDGKDIVKRYYNEYYFVEQHRPDNAVKIIEAQVAFLKSICLPLCISSLCVVKTVKYSCVQGWTIIITILSLMVIIAVAVRRQNTIYRIVIEDYKYLSKQNQK